MVTNVSAAAQSQVGSKANAFSQADITSAFSFNGAANNAYAFATEDPSSSYTAPILASDSNLNSALGGVGATVFGEGFQGASYASTASGSREYISTITWTVDTSPLSGNLIAGFDKTDQSLTAGFSSLVFTIKEDGSVKLSDTFTTLISAQMFFTNDAVNLGAFTQAPDQTVQFIFDLTASSSGQGFGEDFLLGTTGGLSGQMALTGATEGVALPSTTTVATFTDSNTSDLASGFTAEINWGDGTSSAETVSGGDGSFTVDGGHTYADEGNATASVTLTRTSDSSNAVANGNVTVAEADALTAQAVTFSATTGVGFNNAVVATFTDSYGANPAGDFGATINWGDGTTTGGAVIAGGGTFTVEGSHTYATPGVDTVSVTLADDAPGTATATATSTACVTGGVLSSNMVLSSATEGVALAATTTVATFTDSNPSDLASGFTAEIAWGDGMSSAGSVSGSAGSFTVAGGHTYADEGSDPASVTITRTADSAKTTPAGTVTVAEGDALTGSGVGTISAMTGVALTNQVVATFTDSYAANLPGDFSATINWGDGTTSSGAAATVSGGSGSFTVSGTHTYASAAVDTVSVTLADDTPGTATATASSTANITAGALIGAMVLSSATEGVALAATTTVATFTDSNPSDLASGFTAEIAWGDGMSSAGSVSGSAGSFTVAGGHTYADEGSDPASVTITRTADSAKTTPAGTVTVAEGDALTGSGVGTISAMTGVALTNQVVATFTDSYAANLPGDFSATINWGDGTTSSGAAATVSGGSGSFTVSGTHTYASAAVDTVSVTLADDTPGTATATASSTANITAGALIGAMVLSSATEGVALAATTTVATFTDSNPSDLASGFTAEIAWGDGMSSAGSVSGSAGSFTVAGGHTYADEGSDPASVTITRTADSAKTTPAGTVTVAEGDALTGSGVGTISAMTGVALTNQVVATFTDSYAANLPGDFSATINWGDGTTSSGAAATVSGGSGSFTVSGTHTYASAAVDTVSVTLADDTPGTATATASSTANITAGALIGAMVLSSATEGVALAATTTVATFTDSNPSDLASGFTAEIAWGDGMSSAGSVSGSAGSFTVAGGHTYADEGSDPASVTITRTADSAKTTPAGTVTVAEGDALTGSGVGTISAMTGVALTNQVVATFTDSYAANLPGDFSATINWGDGTTSSGAAATVSGGSGSFTVSGTHTYASAAVDTVSVTLADDTPGTATATASSTANITAGALIGAMVLSSATEGVALAATTTVATFTDSNPSDLASGFTAEIAWGDGMSSAGSVSGSAGSFTVAGGHTYADEGSDPASVTITRTADSAKTTPPAP